MQRSRHESLLMCATSLMILAARSAHGQNPVVEAVVLEDRAGRQIALAAGQSAVVGQAGLDVLRHAYIAKGYRATFCDSAGVRARCRRLVGWSESPPARLGPPFSAAGTTVAVERALFGYADLHVHPATHLAWGARGQRGALWGYPGMTLGAGPGVALELAPCAADNHTGTVNPIIQAARTAFVASRETYGHGPRGAPTFSEWPHASSLLHQQMHVTMLRHAFDGGLRLIVASATDNQLVDIIWNPEFSLSQGRFALREDADYKAAAEQFDFIRRFVNANAGWMVVARTPAEARRAISDNKLAVVLGLELDELSAEEILKLQDDYGVALVTPVHLINNSFGGAAAYEMFFNVANFVMNGSFFGVQGDENLGYRFPDLLAELKRTPVIGEVVRPEMLGPIGAQLAQYTAAKGGHRNALGIRDEYGLRRLMKSGLLIDIAHMSSNATDATLSLAQPGGRPLVPLVYTHGGLRWGPKPSERGLSVEQLRDLANSGGLVGLGTGEDESVNAPPPISQWLDRFLETEAGGQGKVALGSDLNGMAKQIRRSELSLEYPTPTIMNVDWTRRSRSLPQFQLVSKPFDIRRDGIAHIGMLPDFLSVVRKQAEKLDSEKPTTDGMPRTRRFDQIFHSGHDFIAAWEQAIRAAPAVNAELPAVAATELKLTLETGTDNLKCGRVMVTALSGSGGGLSPPMLIDRGQAPHSTLRMTLPLMPGTRLTDISRIRFQYLPGGCDPFDTGDTWNIKTLQVTYNVAVASTRQPGVLMHKRGAPARKLDRGSTWTVYTER